MCALVSQWVLAQVKTNSSHSFAPQNQQLRLLCHFIYLIDAPLVGRPSHTHTHTHICTNIVRDELRGLGFSEAARLILPKAGDEILFSIKLWLF